jgi:two-component system LytT family response regulator
MNKFRALVIDDERLARVTLNDMLANFPEIEVVGEAESVEDSIVLINSLHPDVLFLDIQLTDGTGFDLLNRVHFEQSVIFTTANDDYAIRAFEINALHYLLKPISAKKLFEAIARLKTHVGDTFIPSEAIFDYHDRLLVSKGSAFHFIKISEISVISASKDYTLIRTFDGLEFIDDKSMGEWESRLPQKHFLRINRSIIINFDAIERTEKKSLNLVLIHIKNYNEPLRVSRMYYRKIKSKFS